MTFGIGVEGPSDYQFWHKVLHFWELVESKARR